MSAHGDDAARPGLSATALKTLIDEASEHVAGGLLAVPVADTLKKTVVAEAGEVIAQHTVPRADLWAAQTPQMFRAQALSLAISEFLVFTVSVWSFSFLFKLSLSDERVVTLLFSVVWSPFRP